MNKLSFSDETYLHVPKYFRIQQQLFENIRSGIWQPNDMIPSELELCQQFGVSRGTIRRALDELSRQGLIARAPGKPTTVNAPKIPLFSSGFRADIAKKGLTASTKVLSIHRSEVPPGIDDVLEISPGSMVLVIERIIAANNVPIIYETAHIAPPGEPIREEEIQSRSLLQLIPEKCHSSLRKAVESYEPIVLSPQQAELLATHPGALAIRDQAVLFGLDNHPLYVSTAIVRGDKARIITETAFEVESLSS